MRKFTILLSLVLFATIAMAQVNMNYRIDNTSAKKTNKVQTQKADPIWECTFDEAVPLYTIAHDVGEADWVVSDTCITVWETEAPESDGLPVGTMVSSMWLYMGHRDLGEYSESGGSFAWMDGITDLLEETEEIKNAWIQFDGIDLSLVDNPKLTFYQNFKELNGGGSFIDFSIDGGTGWTSVEINTGLDGYDYGDDYFEFVASPYIANEGNVSIRFRFVTDDAALGGYDYGWCIDDINISDNPDYDMKYVHGVMNFIEYYDYLDPEYDGWYHMSSHYGNIPSMQYDYEGALSWFNVCVENKGNITIAPTVSVQVFDPAMVEIFTNTVVGPEIETAQIDTLDLIETDFALGADPELGKYTVVYNISVDGQEDANLENNSDTTYFHINDDQFFSRDIESTSASVSPGTWVDGGVDGEMIGTDFLFLFEDIVTSMDVFIKSSTTPGTSIIGHVMQYDADTEDWVDVGQSPLINLDETNIDGWLNIEFTDPVMIIYDEGYESKTLRAAIEFYYNEEDNDIYIGYDPTVPVSAWGTKWKLLEGSNAGDWFTISNWSRGGLNIRLNFNGYYIGMDDAVEADFISNMSIYPNPTTGMLNIEGIEGADVQIINMMGQVVETMENINEYNQIDMSKYSNGTYFVKAIIGNHVVTRKINLLK